MSLFQFGRGEDYEAEKAEKAQKAEKAETEVRSSRQN